MRKILMIGVILLGNLSCTPPTIKNPVKMYAVNIGYQEAGVGLKNLNILSNEVGEWSSEIIFTPLDDAPNNMMCFSMETWLLRIKPKLKEGNEYYNDNK